MVIPVAEQRQRVLAAFQKQGPFQVYEQAFPPAELPLPGPPLEAVLATDLEDDRQDSGHLESLAAEIVDASQTGPPTEREGQEWYSGRSRWELCAWYQPAHIYGDDWGIVVRWDCVEREAKRVARFLDPPTQIDPTGPVLAEALLKKTFAMFFEHEFFHHIVEAAATRLEMISPAPVYEGYWRHEYQPSFGTDSCLEEALANAFVYRNLAEWRQRPRDYVRTALRRYLLWSFKHDPPGYRLAGKHCSGPSYALGLNDLFERIVAPTGPFGRSRALPELKGVVDPLFAPLAAARTRTVIVSPDPKTAPPNLLWLVVTPKMLIRVAEQDGWKQDRIEGSHIVLTKAGAPRPSTVPNHKDLAKGTLASCRRTMGLSGPELRRRLAQR